MTTLVSRAIHVRTDVMNERGVVEITKFRPAGRLSDIVYERIGDVFRLRGHSGR